MKKYLPALNVNEIDRLLTEAQDATYLGLDIRTVRVWRKTRGLPHIKITGRLIRYRRRDVDAWLERSNRATGEAASNYCPIPIK